MINCVVCGKLTSNAAYHPEKGFVCFEHAVKTRNPDSVWTAYNTYEKKMKKRYARD